MPYSVKNKEEWPLAVWSDDEQILFCSSQNLSSSELDSTQIIPVAKFSKKIEKSPLTPFDHLMSTQIRKNIDDLALTAEFRYKGGHFQSAHSKLFFNAKIWTIYWTVYRKK